MCWLQEADVQAIFEPFGPIDSVTIQRDPAGRSQGFGYVTYAPKSRPRFSVVLHLLRLIGWRSHFQPCSTARVQVAATITVPALPALPVLVHTIKSNPKTNAVVNPLQVHSSLGCHKGHPAAGRAGDCRRLHPGQNGASLRAARAAHAAQHQRDPR